MTLLEAAALTVLLTKVVGVVVTLGYIWTIVDYYVDKRKEQKEKA